MKNPAGTVELSQGSVKKNYLWISYQLFPTAEIYSVVKNLGWATVDVRPTSTPRSAGPQKDPEHVQLTLNMFS